MMKLGICLSLLVVTFGVAAMAGTSATTSSVGTTIESSLTTTTAPLTTTSKSSAMSSGPTEAQYKAIEDDAEVYVQSNGRKKSRALNSMVRIHRARIDAYCGEGKSGRFPEMDIVVAISQHKELVACPAMTGPR